MQIYVSGQWSYWFCSLISGFVFGIIYDLLCSLPLALSKKKQYSFLCDLLFVLSTVAVIMIITFSLNDGLYRGYALLTSFCTFAVYKLSVGKAVLNLYLYIFNKIEFLINNLLNKLKILLDILIKFVKIKIVYLRVVVYRKQMLSKFEKLFSGKETYGKQRK